MSGTTTTRSATSSTWNTLLGAPIVSILVLVTFGAVIGLAMTQRLPDSQSMTMLVGALISMATTVVGFWVGSSASSQAKDITIANAQMPLPSLGATMTTTVTHAATDPKAP